MQTDQNLATSSMSAIANLGVQTKPFVEPATPVAVAEVKNDSANDDNQAPIVVVPQKPADEPTKVAARGKFIGGKQVFKVSWPDGKLMNTGVATLRNGQTGRYEFLSLNEKLDDGSDASTVVWTFDPAEHTGKNLKVPTRLRTKEGSLVWWLTDANGNAMHGVGYHIMQGMRAFPIREGVIFKGELETRIKKMPAKTEIAQIAEPAPVMGEVELSEMFGDTKLYQATSNGEQVGPKYWKDHLGHKRNMPVASATHPSVLAKQAAEKAARIKREAELYAQWFWEAYTIEPADMFAEPKEGEIGPRELIKMGFTAHPMCLVDNPNHGDERKLGMVMFKHRAKDDTMYVTTRTLLFKHLNFPMFGKHKDASEEKVELLFRRASLVLNELWQYGPSKDPNHKLELDQYATWQDLKNVGCDYYPRTRYGNMVTMVFDMPKESGVEFTTEREMHINHVIGSLNIAEADLPRDRRAEKYAQSGNTLGAQLGAGVARTGKTDREKSKLKTGENRTNDPSRIVPKGPGGQKPQHCSNKELEAKRARKAACRK